MAQKTRGKVGLRKRKGLNETGLATEIFLPTEQEDSHKIFRVDHITQGANVMHESLAHGACSLAFRALPRKNRKQIRLSCEITTTSCLGYPISKQSSPAGIFCQGQKFSLSTNYQKQ